MGTKRATKTTEKPKRTRKRAVEPGTRGLDATALTEERAPQGVEALADRVRSDGGSVLAKYKDPLGAHWLVLASLPLDKVSPTPFQRDLSEAHVKRLTEVIDKLDRFLDPIIAVRAAEGGYWTPNGNHRLSAMRKLGARAIVALIAPDSELAYKILALNTEKAHNLREKALEVMRMARALADLDPRPEQEFALEFEDPAFLTLGLAYEQRGRFSGGAYHSLLKRIDAFLDRPLPKALAERALRAERLLEVDDAVVAAVDALKAGGFTSPYLKAFVVARVNPIRFHKGEPPPFDETLDRMLKAAKKFDASKVSTDQIAATGGAPEE